MTHPKGIEAADLAIENERLKTSVMILNQKLRSQEMEEDALKSKKSVLNKL